MRPDRHPGMGSFAVSAVAMLPEKTRIRVEERVFK